MICGAYKVESVGCCLFLLAFICAFDDGVSCGSDGEKDIKSGTQHLCSGKAIINGEKPIDSCLSVSVKAFIQGWTHPEASSLWQA
jgi:hypothetical protein